MKNLFIVLALLFTAHSASAHVLITDQGVGAVFHIDPDDAPAPDATSTVSAIFQSPNFDLTKCGCDVALYKNGVPVFDKFLGDPMFKVTPKNVTFQYVFPSSGAYSVAIAGEEFRLVYEFEVRPAQTAQQMQTSKDRTIRFAFFGAVILFGGYIIMSATRSKNKRKYV